MRCQLLIVLCFVVGGAVIYPEDQGGSDSDYRTASYLFFWGYSSSPESFWTRLTHHQPNRSHPFAYGTRQRVASICKGKNGGVFSLGLKPFANGRVPFTNGRCLQTGGNNNNNTTTRPELLTDGSVVAIPCTNPAPASQCSTITLSAKGPSSIVVVR
jgi:hypothetical protein